MVVATPPVVARVSPVPGCGVAQVNHNAPSGPVTRLETIALGGVNL
jgi:hypothetical protein